MNQRIHQERAGFWIRRDRFCKIAVGALAVLGLCLSVVTISNSTTLWVSLSVAVAFLAAVVAIALNVIPLAEAASEHKALFQRWTDLREDVDALLFDLKDEPTAQLIARLKDLDAKQHRICGSEPAPEESVIKRCYADEVQSRKEEPACAV